MLREVVLAGIGRLAGLGHDEVAQALGIPYGTVASRLSRARTTPREALGGSNPILTLEEQRATEPCWLKLSS